MKPVCKAESRWKYWREEFSSKHRLNKFTVWAKRQMNKAKRQHYKEEIEKELNILANIKDGWANP